ncbi:hypothetical protein JCM10207_001242 [Rhodosporidiobolus poonsookiae]
MSHQERSRPTPLDAPTAPTHGKRGPLLPTLPRRLKLAKHDRTGASASGEAQQQQQQQQQQPSVATDAPQTPPLLRSQPSHPGRLARLFGRRGSTTTNAPIPESTAAGPLAPLNRPSRAPPPTAPPGGPSLSLPPEAASEVVESPSHRQRTTPLPLQTTTLTGTPTTKLEQSKVSRLQGEIDILKATVQQAGADLLVQQQQFEILRTNRARQTDELAALRCHEEQHSVANPAANTEYICHLIKHLACKTKARNEDAGTPPNNKEAEVWLHMVLRRLEGTSLDVEELTARLGGLQPA